MLLDEDESQSSSRVREHGSFRLVSQLHMAIQTLCEGVGGVQGALTLFCGGVAQTCHDDRVVELKEQLVVEEVDGEGQEGKVKEEGRSRVKENAPCR